MPNTLRTVVMVSTSYPADLADWRGLFIRHLTDALARRADISLRLWCPPGELPANARYVATACEQAWLAQLMREGGIAAALRSRSPRALARPWQLLRSLRALYRRQSDADLLHINWLQNALPLPRAGCPALVTVLGSDLAMLRLPGMTALLRRALRRRRVAICPNADWMCTELAARFGDIATIRCVPFGIDPRWFEVQRGPARPARWVCVSRVTAAKIGPLFEWGAAAFARGERELHLFGPMQQQVQIPDWVHYHGATNPDALRNEWFPAASGFISLSRHAEGRPQVLLEAMAAGLPIVASRIPAHEDLLEHGRTGWLCNDEPGLLDALHQGESPDAAMQTGQRARAQVRTQIGTWDDCAERYAAIYRDLLGR